MISLTEIVWIVVTLLIVIVILGLLWFLIGYIEKKTPAEWGWAPAYNIVRIVFVVLVVLLAIFYLIGLISGRPIIRL